jgi:ribosomal protein L16 Arg81 hydroxylase
MPDWAILQSELLPDHTAEEISSVWNTEGRHFPKANNTNLLSFHELKSVFSFHKFQPSDLLLISESNPKIDHTSYLRPDGLVDLPRVMKFYQQGYTIVINRTQNFWPSHRILCQNLHGFRQENVSINAYITPANSQGFPVHYDPHNIFILQTDGSKNWSIHDEVDPVASERSHRRLALGASNQQNSFHLEKGDILYLPKGYAHKAETNGEASIHLSIHFEEHRISDLLHSLIDVSEIADTDFRQPINLSDNTRQLEELMHNCIQKLNDPIFQTQALKNLRSKIQRHRSLESTTESNF